MTKRIRVTTKHAHHTLLMNHDDLDALGPEELDALEKQMDDYLRDRWGRLGFDAVVLCGLSGLRRLELDEEREALEAAVAKIGIGAENISRHARCDAIFAKEAAMLRALGLDEEEGAVDLLEEETSILQENLLG